MPKSLPFDTNEFVCVRAPVVDECEVKGEDCSVKVTRRWLEETSSNMNREFEASGTLSNIIIGHTGHSDQDEDETKRQTVGFLHNWSVEPFVDGTGNQRAAIFADHWFKKENEVVVDGVPLKLSAKELLFRWPHRSGELWIGRKEIKPHALLAKAPERNLGILQLHFASDGGLKASYSSPGKIEMAGPMAPPRNVTPEAAGDASIFAMLKSFMAELQAVVADLKELKAAVGQPAQADPSLGDPSQGGEPAAGEPNDDEINQILAELQQYHGGEGNGEGGEDDDKGAPPEEPEEPKKMARQEPAAPAALPFKEMAELIDLRLKLSRTEVEKALTPKGKANDLQLIEQLVKLEPSARNSIIAAFPDAKNAAKVDNLDTALQLARNTVDTNGGLKKITDKETMDRLASISTSEGESWQKTCARLGYDPGC